MRIIPKDQILQNYSRKEIKDFVYGYACLPFSFSLYQYICGCNLEIETFESMISISISHCIVSDKIVDILEQKAVLTAYNYSETLESSIRSVKTRYDNLRDCRKKFSFSNVEVMNLIVKYASSPFPQKEFCKTEGITLYLFHRSFVRGICTCLVSDNILSRLYEKSILHATDKSDVDNLYKILIQARSNYQQVHHIT